MSGKAAGSATPFVRHLTDPPCAGEMPGADWIGEAGSLGQGDLVRLFARADGGTMADVRFMAFGCAATLAAASCLAEMLLGLSPADARRLGPGEIATALGGLRQDQAHGAHLAHGALLALLADARGESLPLSDSPLICSCFRVSQATVAGLIAERHLGSLEQVTQATMAGKGCGSCHGELRALIAASTGRSGAKPSYVPLPAAGLSDQQRAARIMDELDRLRPLLQAGGRDAMLVDLAGEVCVMRFLGLTGPDDRTPLPLWVESRLRAALGPGLRVEVSQ